MPRPAIGYHATRMKAPTGAARAALALVLAVAAVLATSGCRARDQQAAPAAGWNLLLVTLDTLRADRLGCYGRDGAETPALDAIAAGGLRFEQAQSAVPLTLPSHATILSGLLPPRHGLRDNGQGTLPADVTTLATRLADAGYRTGAFVGAFVLDHRYGLARGFERYDDEILRRGSALEAERPGSEVVDRALAWLDERPAVEGAGVRVPFFAWVHLYDPHAPYEPPEPFRSRHAGDPYGGEIASTDAQVARLTAWLARRRETARTIVVVVADHGESLGEHGELTHGLLLYQPTLRVPLLLSAPGVLAPRVVREPVGLADLAPTLAALLGQPLAGARDGRDLSAALLAGGEPPAADLYAESHYPATFGWSPLVALRRGALKLIEAPSVKPVKSTELYDLAADPGEARDLRAERRRDAAALTQALAALAKDERRAAPAAADAESRARLAALGYAAPSAAAATQAGTRDPKSAVALFRAYEEAHAAEQQGRLAEAAALLRPLVAADPTKPRLPHELRTRAPRPRTHRRSAPVLSRGRRARARRPAGLVRAGDDAPARRPRRRSARRARGSVAPRPRPPAGAQRARHRARQRRPPRRRANAPRSRARGRRARRAGLEQPRQRRARPRPPR